MSAAEAKRWAALWKRCAKNERAKAKHAQARQRELFRKVCELTLERDGRS